ncbi:hypothetical protein cypCar_00010946 [Cyprinus carpio]|nr:hypothetical protein cypCar_00010946 [Cyprinus carpio]
MAEQISSWQNSDILEDVDTEITALELQMKTRPLFFTRREVMVPVSLTLTPLFADCLFKEKKGRAFKTSNLPLSSSTLSPCEIIKKALAPSWLDGSRGKSSEPMPGKEPSAWATAEFCEHLTIIFRHCSRDNEAGGEDALVGNVNKLMVTPPGYTGPPKKGHIIFDACFESGNLGRVDYISEFEFDLFIRPDTCNPRFRVWFNFTVENVRETQLPWLYLQ